MAIDRLRADLSSGHIGSVEPAIASALTDKLLFLSEINRVEPNFGFLTCKK